MTDPQFHYYSWVRVGNTQLISALDDPSDTNRPARAEITVSAKVTTVTPNLRAKGVTVRLFGPGDITGLDKRQVIRTDPPHRATDFEPNLFPLIEFYWPALPWLFTPTAPYPTAGALSSRLRPWLCMVVTEQEGSTLTQGNPLPVLTVNSPAEELPDLSESWAWAHAQITGPIPDGDAGKLLAATSDSTLSRLVCPRKLKEGVAYRACVVPVFEVGRKAGLGLDLKDDLKKLDPAWKSDTPGPLMLPVYYHWEFQTGRAGDFEALVWELRPRPVSDNSGYRPLIVHPPAADWPAGQTTTLGSALRPPDAVLPADNVSATYHAKLRELLNASDDWEGKVPLPAGMPLPPPFYAHWQAGQQTVPDDAAVIGQPGNARWLRQLNLEIGYRAAAGLGAQVVREQQEGLMASAWEQLGEIDRANEALRHAQLAMEVGRRIYEQHLEPLAATAPATLLALTGPVHRRVYHAATQRTVRGRMAATCLPVAAVQGAFRRLTRPRGPLGRRLGGSDHTTSRLLEKLNSSNPPTMPPRPVPAGMVAPHNVELRPFCQMTPEVIDAVRPSAETRPEYSDRRKAFSEAAQQLQRALLAFCVEPRSVCNPLDISAECERLLTGLRPEKTVPARIGDRLILPEGRSLEPALDPILAHPVFPQAMYRSLAELSEHFLFSDIDKIPPDTICLLESNAGFIEAFMAGLNDEMGRELLWRGFPTDRRGTYFRRFWDPRSNLNKPHADTRDIKAMDEWGPGEDLGTHRPSTTPGSLAVLLVRGRLLQRFPNALIFAAQARWATDGSGRPVQPRRPVQPVTDSAAGNYLPPNDENYPERYPVFEGTLPPDLTFRGFDLSADDMRGTQDPADNKPGWFIVLQQQPTQPRYGLDETRSAQQPETWADLSWADVGLTATNSGCISIAKGLTAFPQPTKAPDNAMKWDSTLTSAQLAYMTLQTPVRVAIHASDLLDGL